MYDSTLDRLGTVTTWTAVMAYTGTEVNGIWTGPDGPCAQSECYEAWRNRTHREGWGGSYGASNINENFTYSNNKQVGLSYDAAGNYTASGAISYDATGQQINSGGGVTNAYDGDRLRGKKVESGATTYYLRSSVLGGQVVAEIKGDGSWQRGFVYVGGQMVAVQQNSVTGITAQTTHWVFQDPVTKSHRLTNSAGTVVSTVDLDPFGGETARSSSSAFQPHRYTTYERDGNGTDDAMHRRFDATASRVSVARTPPSIAAALDHDVRHTFSLSNG